MNQYLNKYWFDLTLLQAWLGQQYDLEFIRIITTYTKVNTHNHIRQESYQKEASTNIWFTLCLENDRNREERNEINK